MASSTGAYILSPILGFTMSFLTCSGYSQPSPHPNLASILINRDFRKGGRREKRFTRKTLFGQRDYFIFSHNTGGNGIPWKLTVEIKSPRNTRSFFGFQVCYLLKHEPCCDHSVTLWARKKGTGKDDKEWEGNIPSVQHPRLPLLRRPRCLFPGSQEHPAETAWLEPRCQHPAHVGCLQDQEPKWEESVGIMLDN